MMEEVTTKLIQLMTTEPTRFVEETERALRGNIRRGVRQFRGKLLQEFDIRLITDIKNFTVVIQPILPVHGWMVDKHGYFANKAPVEVLKEYILDRGISSFPYIPGYEPGSTLPTDDMAANRIAWGMKKSRQLKRNTLVPRDLQYFHLPYYSDRATFRDKITSDFFEIAGTETFKAITRALRGRL